MSKEKRRYSIKNAKIKLNQNINKPQTLEEYFLVIGVEPKLCTKDYLYNNSIEDLNKYYIKDEFKPKILSKFPPINKQYINIDSSLIELLFPKGYELIQSNNQPKPITHHFILDNSFYSIDFPLKYVTCLQIFENLENYYLLNNEIKNKLGDDYYNNTWKMNTGKKSKNDFLKAINDIDDNFLEHKERFKSDIYHINLENINDKKDNRYKYYYFPKILCLVSTQHFFNEQELILKQIYNYFLEENPKKIPLEKKILTILCNIPIPPKGLLEIDYNLKDNYQKIRLRREKMNKIPLLEDELKFMFSKFSINKMLKIFKYILFEMKTIVFSTKINELSLFIYGLISLLFPLHYSFQVSSYIPNGAYDVLESISPYILGINTKFEKSFFSKNKIDIDDLNIFLIDLDDKKIRIVGSDNLPEIPKSLYNPLKDGLEEIFEGKNNKKNINDLFKVNYKSVRLLFYDFFINLLSDYNLYIKKDYFKNKLTNTGIKHLFKIKEFIESHAHGEKQFYKKFTETQMFSDFIYKKMIPKNLNEKLEILLVDESLIRKNNKKLFSKKKAIVFLDSKEYEHSLIYEIPQSKLLSEREKNFFRNEEERKSLLLYGQKINTETNKETNEENYLFEYYVFPILNKSFYDSPPPGEYFLAPDSIIFSDVDRANTDIISKSMNNSYKSNKKNSSDKDMKNYIYLTYIELWAYTYWYLDSSEKDKKFNQMLEILDKITHHEVELFDILFEALNKFKEEEKILQLYDCLLKYKILPSSFIYSIVNSLLNKNKMSKSSSSNSFSRVNSDIISKKKSQKRTFHSLKEGNLFGDKVIFYSKQPCPECDKEIDIIDISLNFKSMKKEMFWAQCPFCEKDIIPKLGVILGSEIVNKNNNNDYNTSKYTKFILHSPYELKNNIRNIINKDGFKLFHLEYFKENYPSLFWSCVWYFKINRIDLDIILPYENNSVQDWNNLQKSIPNNINASTKENIEKENEKNMNIIHLKNEKKIKKNKKVNIKKYSNDKLLIHSIISLQIDENNYRFNQDYNMSSIGSILDIFRRSTLSSNNKKNSFNFGKFLRNSVKNKTIDPTFRSDIKKKQSMKISFPYSLNRVRLNTQSKKSLQSPHLNSRRLYESINSSDLLSIKENEDYFVSSFNNENTREENDENDENDEFFLERMYSNKETNTFNFEDDNNIDINNNSFIRKRSFDFIKKDRISNLNVKKYKRNNSMSNKRIEVYSFF